MTQHAESSIESRALARSGQSTTSPALEVLNSAASLAAVVALTLVGGVILHAFVNRRSA